MPRLTFFNFIYYEHSLSLSPSGWHSINLILSKETVTLDWNSFFFFDHNNATNATRLLSTFKPVFHFNNIIGIRSQNVIPPPYIDVRYKKNHDLPGLRITY